MLATDLGRADAIQAADDMATLDALDNGPQLITIDEAAAAVAQEELGLAKAAIAPLGCLRHET